MEEKLLILVEETEVKNVSNSLSKVKSKEFINE